MEASGGTWNVKIIDSPLDMRRMGTQREYSGVRLPDGRYLYYILCELCTINYRYHIVLALLLLEAHEVSKSLNHSLL